MLDNKKLVAQATDRGHRADGDPQKYRPSDDSALGDGVCSDLSANVIVWRPVCEPVRHMDGRSQEKASRGPAV